MSYSEQVLEAIIEISIMHGCNLFEAAIQYCEDSDLDPTEFAASLDAGALERIKFAAMEGRHVRQCVQRLPKKLP